MGTPSDPFVLARSNRKSPRNNFKKAKKIGPVTPVANDIEDFFDNGGVALHLVGPDGLILKANKAELELLGYTADEYVGRHIAEFHANRAAIADILQRLARGEKVDKHPAQLRAKDGSIKDVLVTSSVQSVKANLSTPDASPLT